MAELRPHSEPHPDVAGWLLGSLDPEEARRFAEHLASCPPCKEEVGALAGLPGLLSDLPPPDALPPDLEDRTFARIEQEAATAPVVAAGGAGTGMAAIGSARRRRTIRALTVAAAAAVVVAAGVGVASRFRHRSVPALATISLVAADGGPAHATATIRTTPAGLIVDMTVADLAPSPPTSMYTCWLVAADDSPGRADRVSVGSFVVRHPHAAVTVHWTTVADLGHFSHLGITREPSNGNPAHQGPRVLVSG